VKPVPPAGDRAYVTFDELVVVGVLICHHNDCVSGRGLFSAQFNE